MLFEAQYNPILDQKIFLHMERSILRQHFVFFLTSWLNKPHSSDSLNIFAALAILSERQRTGVRENIWNVGFEFELPSLGDFEPWWFINTQV